MNAQEFKVTYSLSRELLNFVKIIDSRISQSSENEFEKNRLKELHRDCHFLSALRQQQFQLHYLQIKKQ